MWGGWGGGLKCGRGDEGLRDGGGLGVVGIGF